MNVAMAGLDIRRGVGSAFIVGALLLVPLERVQAQRADAVLRSWICVARSVAAGSMFSSVAADPQCSMSTSIAWSSLARIRPQDAISPPGVPSSLGAVVSGRNVVLNWAAPVTGGAATSYVVQAGSASGLADLASANTASSVPTLTVTDVPPGTYYVRVIAANAGGVSAPSIELQVVVGAAACTSAPGVPVSLTSSITTTTVTFAWLASSGSPSGHILQFGSSPGSSNLAVINVGSATIYSVTGVPAGTYYVRALATNTCGTSPASNEVTVIVGGRTTVVMALHGFRGSPDDGSNWSTIIQGTDGNFYGTSVTGGPFDSSCNTNLTGCGIAFKITPTGVFTVLYQFHASGLDHNAAPIHPYSTLLQASDGNFYGTTDSGGAANVGTIFRIRSDGTFTTLYSFTGGADGSHPYASLIQGSDGNFYGSTTYGTSYNAGTLFRMTPAGAVTILHTFTGYNVQDNTRPPGVPTDGAFPGGALLQAPDGNYYGTTAGGGGLGGGTAFVITPAGVYTQLYAFAGNDEGGSPTSPLVRATDGSFYGTTQYGGVVNMGAVFKMTVP